MVSKSAYNTNGYISTSIYYISVQCMGISSTFHPTTQPCSHVGIYSVTKLVRNIKRRLSFPYVRDELFHRSFAHYDPRGISHPENKGSYFCTGHGGVASIKGALIGSAPKTDLEVRELSYGAWNNTACNLANEGICCRHCPFLPSFPHRSSPFPSV